MTYSGAPDTPPADLASRGKGKGTDREGHVAAYDDVEDDHWNGPNPMGIVQAVSAGASMDRREMKSMRKAERAERKAERKFERAERKAERRTGRRGRIEYSKDVRASAGENWRLVVAYNPPVL